MINILLTTIVFSCLTVDASLWGISYADVVDTGKITTEDTLIGPVDITHQELHLSIDPRKRYIRGHVTTTFLAGTDPVPTFRIDLHNDLTIDSVLNTAGKKLSFIRNDDHSTDITLADTLSRKNPVTISVFYQGVPPEDGFGSFVREAHATDSIIWTLSEPYGARNWWPCRQNLSDKIDSLDLWITVPKGYRAAGNGLLISEKPQNDSTVLFHWKHRYPIATYLVAFAVTNYRVHEFDIELENGPLPIVNYLYPQDYDRHSQQIENILPGMMQLFEDLFIPYPFDREKYGHAQFGFRGGMEHQTMSFMGGFSYSLTAHELAHQWFGDYITCGTWEDIWLNEGFASYLTGLTYEHILKNNSWENYLTSTIRDITSQPGGSVIVPDTTDFRRIFNSRLSYKKGSMVLHMLRWIVGDDHFYEGVRQYLLDENTRYAFARTRHLMNHMEKVSGIDLDEFFADWYLGEGYPSYHLQWENTETGIRLLINQTTSSFVPFFEIPLEVGLYGADQDSLVRLDIQENGQTFDLELDWEVDSIAVDPRHWLISAGNTAAVITANSPNNLDETSITVFPNPALNSINVKNNSPYTISKVNQYSLTGQLISSRHVYIRSGHTGSLHLKNQKPGFYIVVLEGESGQFAPQKIIIR